MEKANSKHNILLVLLKRNIYPTCLKLLCFFPSSANTVLTLKHPRLSSEASLHKENSPPPGELHNENSAYSIRLTFLNLSQHPKLQNETCSASA